MGAKRTLTTSPIVGAPAAATCKRRDRHGSNRPSRCLGSLQVALQQDSAANAEATRYASRNRATPACVTRHRFRSRHEFMRHTAGPSSLGLRTICSPRRDLFAVLLVADVLHPVDDLAVLRFLNGDMRHRIDRRGAVPMFFAGRKPDDVARRISSTGLPQRCTRPTP